MKTAKSILFLLVLILILSVACNRLLSFPLPKTTPSSPTITTSLNTSTTTQGTLEVYFLDVGQADCEIVRYQNSTMIIDEGTNAGAPALVNSIKSMGISKFDIAIGTHPHEDHIGGLDTVINTFPISTLYMPNATANTKTYADVLTAIKYKGYKVTTPIPMATFNLGNARCTILAPNSPKYDDLNNNSIVIKLEYGNTSFLFAGDAQSISEQEMIAKGYDLKADVLKVGHHGSDSSTTPAFLKAVSPKYAVIEVGMGNTFGHPHQVTLDKLAKADVKVYRTDLNGTITFKSDGSAITVTTVR